MNARETGVAVSPWAIVRPQIDKATRSLNDYNNFLKRRAKIEREYASALRQLADSFPPPAERGRLVGGAWEQLITFTRGEATLHQKTAAAIVDSSAPLEASQDSYKTASRELLQRGDSLTKSFDDAVLKTTKARNAYVNAHREHDAAAASDQVAVASQKQADLSDAQQAYREAITAVNSVQGHYFSPHGVEKLLIEFKNLETMRVQKIKLAITRILELFIDGGPKREALARESVAFVKQLDTKQDISRFIQSSASVATVTADSATDFSFDAYDPNEDGLAKMSTFRALKARGKAALIAARERREAGAGEDSGSGPEQPASNLFGRPLAHVLRRDRLARPDVEVPLILTELCTAILTLGGESCDGIFRQAIGASEMNRLVEQFESGDFSMPPSTDPHGPACVLKSWLRSLADPLISQYEDALAMSSTEDVLSVYSKMGPLEQRVARTLLKFLLRLSKHSSETRMDVKNLATVFAPSFLRSTNAAAMLQNIESEQSCVAMLIETADQLPEPGPLPTNLDLEVDESAARTKKAPPIPASRTSGSGSDAGGGGGGGGAKALKKGLSKFYSKK